MAGMFPKPRRQELMQINSKINREPHWHFGTRHPLEYHHGILLKEGDRPAGYHPHDAHRDTHGRYKRDPAFSFGATAYGRPGTPESRPGPGDYRDISLDKTGRKSPAWGFGSKGERRGVESLGGPGPGPGLYNTSGDMGGKKYSIAHKYSKAHRAPYPGPGQYWWPEDRGARVSRWGDAPLPKRAVSAGPAPGRQHQDLGGPKYTMQVPRPERMPELDTRHPGHHLTQFGHHGK
mmetsp:Transcript_52233/g.113790  ORF Transcript_52233/g.113790 Transcript_52233/m.113790 type:complete len:234 (-) Transcript_52233:94-795(-)